MSLRPRLESISLARAQLTARRTARVNPYLESEAPTFHPDWLHRTSRARASTSCASGLVAGAGRRGLRPRRGRGCNPGELEWAASAGARGSPGAAPSPHLDHRDWRRATRRPGRPNSRDSEPPRPASRTLAVMGARGRCQDFEGPMEGIEPGGSSHVMATTTRRGNRDPPTSAFSAGGPLPSLALPEQVRCRVKKPAHTIQCPSIR